MAEGGHSLRRPLVELDKEISFAKIIICVSGSSSVVERDLAKVEVASSSLVSRSKLSEATPQTASLQLLEEFFLRSESELNRDSELSTAA